MSGKLVTFLGKVYNIELYSQLITDAHEKRTAAHPTNLAHPSPLLDPCGAVRRSESAVPPMRLGPRRDSL